jgi:DNA-binding winged helix-turn-helix (wHTH) protein
MDRRELIDGDKSAKLTRREADFLELLAASPRVAISHQSLIASLWPSDEPDSANLSLKVMAFHIRKKCDWAPVILTQWGFGFRIASPVEVRRAGPQPIFIRPDLRRSLERLLSTHPDHAAADRVLASFVGA